MSCRRLQVEDLSSFMLRASSVRVVAHGGISVVIAVMAALPTLAVDS